MDERKRLSVDERQRLLFAYGQGTSRKDLAAQFGISYPTVCNLVNKFALPPEGEPEPRLVNGQHHSVREYIINGQTVLQYKGALWGLIQENE